MLSEMLVGFAVALSKVLWR